MSVGQGKQNAPPRADTGPISGHRISIYAHLFCAWRQRLRSSRTWFKYLNFSLQPRENNQSLIYECHTRAVGELMVTTDEKQTIT